MKWWYFINYKIYKLYYKFYKNTFDPAVYSAAVSAVLIQLNILCISYLIYLWIGIKILFHVATVIVIYTFVLLFNYFTIYKDKKYLQIFEDMEKWEEKEKKTTIFFNLYFFISAVVFVLLFISA